MFDALLKSKFYSKCKTAIKITKTRIEMIKRKRNAMEKFLKKDIVDLLNNGLDFNAYGRAEGLLIELNMSACYNFVGKFCVCLLKQVSLMDKQRDCPGECREAVSSLMYAAARFADLPELRELRDMFIAKYGNTIEANINQEFVTRLKAAPPTKEMKVQLLQNIAVESGKNWDSKALEQKLYVPPSSEHGLSKDTNDVNSTLPKYKEKPANRINKKDNENKKRNLSVPSSPRRLNDLPSYRTVKTNVDRSKIQEHKNSAIHAEDSEKVISSPNKLDETDENKPFQSKFSPPPPYHRRSSTEVKHETLASGKNLGQGNDTENRTNRDIQGKRSNKNDSQNNLRSRQNRNDEESEEIKFYQRKFAPVSYRRRKFSWDQEEDLQNENSSSKDINNKPNPEKVKSGEKQPFQSKFASSADPKAETFTVEEKTQQLDNTDKTKPKSVRSVRSRRSIIPPVEVNIVKNDDILDAVRQELATKPGHKSSNVDEDERDINDFLMHNWKRDSPRSGKGTSARRTSFGSELTSARDKKINPGRSSSYQLDTKSVHPKLPNYDDFVTRVTNLTRD